MSPVALIALLGWIPVVLVIFQVLPVRLAAVSAYLLGWLFLPVAGIDLPGPLDLTKTSAITLSVLLGILTRDPGCFQAARIRWFDIPAIVYCLCPAASVFSNGLGAYDALAFSLPQGVNWGLPYLTGRLLLGDPEGVDLLARGIIIGGLIYVPICLWEIRMSPTLHHQIYGYTPPTAWQTVVRFGGYRPLGFLQTGLALGMWMTAASLIGIWLWSSGRLRHLGSWRFGPILLVLLGTTVLCKSTGALALLLIGVACLIAARLGRWPATALVLTLLAIPPFYAISRSSGLWSGRNVVELSAALIDQERARSLEFRMINEDILAARALERPLLGWGGWGRNRRGSESDQRVVTDGYWIIILGLNGIVGLSAMMLLHLLPGFRLWWRHSAESWAKPPVDAAAPMAILLGLIMVDHLSNAMPSPIYPLIAGALMGLRLPSASRSPMPEVASAFEAFQAIALDRGSPSPVSLETTTRHPAYDETFEAADRELEQTLWEAEQSALTVEGGETLVFDLIQRELELVQNLRAGGLDSEACLVYQRALDRGERLLGRLAGSDSRSEADSRPGPSGEVGQSVSIIDCWERAIDLWERFDAVATGIPEVRVAWAEACNNLAWRLALESDPSSGDPERACRLARTAVTLMPDQFSHWNTLALTLVRQRDWNQASEALEQAQRLAGTPSPFNLYVLAIVRAQQREYPAAREALRLADSLAQSLPNPGARADLKTLRNQALTHLKMSPKALVKPS